LSVDKLCLRGGGARSRSLADITFSLRSGEILGVAGLMGAGRTELLETLFGVPDRSKVTGTITVDGVRLRPASPSDAIRAGLAFVTEDRKQLSLIMTFTVCYNITLVALRKFLHWSLIGRAAELSASSGFIEKLRIKTPGAQAMVGALSGGNQQKVVLAKWLLNDPKVLLLDEPTRGIDVGAKAEIYTLISHLASEGAAIIMCSSEMPELLAMCDRIMVMSAGHLTATFSRAEATQERILEAATAA
jgi:ABC-type sugar transport system ATPase subunit